MPTCALNQITTTTSVASTAIVNQCAAVNGSTSTTSASARAPT